MLGDWTIIHEGHETDTKFKEHEKKDTKEDTKGRVCDQNNTPRRRMNAFRFARESSGCWR